jgi:hypothetical protein
MGWDICVFVWCEVKAWNVRVCMSDVCGESVRYICVCLSDD